MKDFHDLKNLIPGMLKKYQLSRQAQAATVCKRFRELAPGMIGEESLANVRPKFFRGHTLTVAVPSSLWAQKVYVRRHDLIMRLNMDLEADTVHEIRTVVEPF